ncbi:SDP6 [Scenedesmus sp. PABB004]|nr:SDP6 [Scenedesmus sp. PABB004]
MLSSRLAPWLGVLGIGAGGGILLNADDGHGSDVQLATALPSRAAHVKALSTSRAAPFDLLVIGGGATGSGIALDAATRGLRTAMIERADFGSGTSSKSTKLVHGGVRYLEKAVFGLDLGQLKLVYEALQERRALLDNAPHLTSTLPILMPCFKWWEVPFYWAGLKAYDLVALGRNLAMSRYLPPAESLRRLPTLAEASPGGASLKGAILYYDGAFDDARLNVALATTAAAAGAAVANYVEATGLIRDAAGQVVGAHCRDKQSGRKFDVHARVVINAAGPYVDSVRRLGEPNAAPAVTASSGAHVTLPEWYGAAGTGLIVPKTKDGRVVFLLPFQGAVIAGTTDAPCGVLDAPSASGADVAFILDAIADYLAITVRREDVLSTWSGIRPLAADPTAGAGGATAGISRDHVIFSEPNGLITITGGKWTTYRRMAQDAVDAALATGKLSVAHQCATPNLRLLGARGFTNTLTAQVTRRRARRRGAGAGRRRVASRRVALTRAAPPPPAAPQVAQQASGLLPGSAAASPPVARHLAAAYGDQAPKVLALAAAEKLGGLLVQGHPYLEAEVLHACRQEYCVSVTDFLARRTRLAFLDAKAAQAAVPRVAELMAAELKWGGSKRRAEVKAAHAYLATFATPPAPKPAAAPARA